MHNHSLKVKAKVRARGTRGQNWNPRLVLLSRNFPFALVPSRYNEKRVNFIRARVRTQNAWLLHLAGDHHASYENKQVLHTPHLMRCMLSANLAVDQRFANGTQGRLLHWSPEVDVKKAVPASHPDLGARFVKESAVLAC